MQVTAHLVDLRLPLRNVDDRVDLLLVQVLSRQVFEGLSLVDESLSFHQQRHITDLDDISLPQMTVVVQTIRNGLHIIRIILSNLKEVTRDGIDNGEHILADSPSATRSHQSLHQRIWNDHVSTHHLAHHHPLVILLSLLPPRAR